MIPDEIDRAITARDPNTPQLIEAFYTQVLDRAAAARKLPGDVKHYREVVAMNRGVVIPGDMWELVRGSVRHFISVFSAFVEDK